MDPFVRSPLPEFGALAAAHSPSRPLTSCGVCGAALVPGRPRCLRCGTPPGAIVNPNDPTATVYLPFGPHVPLTPLFRSGEEKAESAANGPLAGWNWGAALLPTLWAMRHRVPWLAGASGLLSALLISLYLVRAAMHHAPDASGTLTGFLITCVVVFAAPRSIYAGLRGNAMAWRSGRYPDRDSLRKAQRSWTVWAIIGVTITALLLGVAAAMLNGG